MIEAVKMLGQDVGLDECGSLKLGLRDAKDICDGIRW